MSDLQVVTPLSQEYLAHSASAPRTREEICTRIEQLGVLPSIRAYSLDAALFAAEAVAAAGIPVVEVDTNSSAALDVISRLVKQRADVVVGAGGILNATTARQCLDRGAKFLTMDGLLRDVVDLAASQSVVAIPGALTPSEVIVACNTGADFVKVSPCDAMGGHTYIRSLKSAVPQARLIAAGGVDQHTAFEFVKAGAAALHLGSEIFPEEGVRRREDRRIAELAHRFLVLVNRGRARN